MDPNQLLKEIRECQAKAEAGFESLDEEIANYEALAEKVKNLDEWLVSGGFLPKDWENGRRE